MLKTNEIYNIDCMEGLKLIDDNSIDLVIIDPPYLLNINKVKNVSNMNKYANDLLNLKDGFDLKVLDLLIQKMKKINIYINFTCCTFFNIVFNIYLEYRSCW